MSVCVGGGRTFHRDDQAADVSDEVDAATTCALASSLSGSPPFPTRPTLKPGWSTTVPSAPPHLRLCVTPGLSSPPPLRICTGEKQLY